LGRFSFSLYLDPPCSPLEGSYLLSLAWSGL
jgi:hypothetical protein